MQKLLSLLFVVFVGCMSINAQFVDFNENANSERKILSYSSGVPGFTGRDEIWISINKQDTTYQFRVEWNMQNAGFMTETIVINMGNDVETAISVLDNWINAIESKRKIIVKINEDYRFQFVGNNKWFRILRTKSDDICAAVRCDSLYYLRNRLRKGEYSI